jgi:histidinol-phosphatase (PHP family)
LRRGSIQFCQTKGRELDKILLTSFNQTFAGWLYIFSEFKMIMNYFNLHTHSNFCDGSGEPEEFVLSALEKGFHSIGFSSHAPVPFKNNFAIKDDNELHLYCQAIRELQHIYRDRISVFLALEIDFIEGVTGDFNEFRQSCKLDYTIGSVHLVKNEIDDNLWFIDGSKRESYDNGLKNYFGGDARKAVHAYYHQVTQMLLAQKPDILGHFDKIKMHNQDRYFREDEPWYRNLIMDLLEIIAQSGVIVEVNTRGIYKKRCDELYPGQWILKEIKRKNIPITLSADAHRPEEIDGYYAETLEILRNIGFNNLVSFNGNGWKEIEI